MAIVDRPAFEARATHTGPDGPYGYVPTEWICILFVVLFSVTSALHLGQALYYRLWFLFPTVILGGIGEIIGWSGRLWSSRNITLLDPFLMQITTTIIAPTPLVAANFVILGQLIRRLGPKYSRLSPIWYTIVFVTCDLVALVVQAVGGANASLAVQDGRDPGPGGNIMLGGIIVQLVAIVIYMALAAEFVIRFVLNKPIRNAEGGRYEGTHQLDTKIKLMLTGLIFSSVVIFIRSIYRTIELTDGWDGRIIGTQVYFNVLDGGMITLAFYCMNIFHPGCLLGNGKEWKRTNSLETIQVDATEEKKRSNESYAPSAV
ncbi:hypothetical protein NLI96_g2984 [Meripilus lineatus]|uniref:RTA1-domain-containing protein n=1 Tax=Meripilus lineatus TaxID=2056292 RepID=A0AAD5V9U1_9APHY|nr:hypothetical protein NLI96_g2984 [Physisporinus lineatus]